MTLVPLDFVGRWTIERQIDDALTSECARFTGNASITRIKGDWLYRETGQLNLASGHQMRAERTYYWRPRSTGFDVFFEDSRFFHRFDLGDTAEARHWCDPDQYEVAYTFSRWPIWKSKWNVAGPSKSYVMQSTFAPLA